MDTIKNSYRQNNMRPALFEQILAIVFLNTIHSGYQYYHFDISASPIYRFQIIF